MSYKIRLRTFEGPFDLLVYLIENARMSIYDIQISEITAQYLAYMEEMKEMDIALGSEFMLLAAQLIDIKSRMILPRFNEDGEAVVDSDPRSELVEKLLEYKKFKELSARLADMEEENMKVREKPQEDISEYTDSPDEYLALDMDKFMAAFNNFIHRRQKLDEVRKRYVRVRRERENTENRIRHIRNVFRVKGVRKISFSELVVDAKDRYDVVLTFTSVLEMIKSRLVSAKQPRRFGEITVTELGGNESDGK